MNWQEYGFEREVKALLMLRRYGGLPEACAELGGHLWTPLAGGEVLGGHHGLPRYRLVRCLRCGQSERRLVLDEEQA